MSRLWLFVLLVAFVIADWPYNSGPKTLSVGNPFYTTLQANLRAGANFTLTGHKSPIQICFNENFPVPPNASNWKWSCTYQYSYDPTQSVGTVFLRNTQYNVGIYFDGSDSGRADEQITFRAGSGHDTCPTDKVFNTLSCQPVTTLEAEENLNITFVAGEPQIFKILVPTLTGSLSVYSFDTPSPLSFALRREGAPAPTVGLFDGTTGTKPSFSFPRPGTYYLYALSFNTQKVNLNVSIEDCRWADHSSGPGCGSDYNHDDPVSSLTGVEGSYYYWAVYNVGPSKDFRVSVYPAPGYPIPNVFASRGNLPQKGNAEISNCNINGCSSVNIISRKTVTNETWYVAVTPAVGANGTKYAIWFGSVCYPGCQDNGGTCQQDGNNVGVCQCSEPTDKGAACQDTQKVAQQYVVLGAIWGTAAAVTVGVLVIYFMTSQKQSYERIA